MLQKNRIYLIPTAIAAIGLLAFTSACGSDDSESEGGTPEPDKKCEDCATPPEVPAAGAQGDGDGTTLAISKLYLGDTDRSGTPSPTAWKSYGYDLDGYNSRSTSVTHCKVNGNGTKSNIQTDGNDGIDNSFGANILTVITGLDQTLPETVNETIAEGSFTVILKVDGVGGGSDYVDLPAALYAGAELGSTPAWDGSDEWPVFCELMTDCKESGTSQLPGNQSKVKFANSYLAGGTWVSGSKTMISLSLAIAGYSLDLDINQAVITADMSGGNPPTQATNGIIAGVLETEALISSLTQIAGSISASLCSGPTLESVSDTIRGASDIMQNGTQDPSAVCDGISVGLGFDMMPVTLGPVLDKNPPGEDPCADVQ